MKRALVLVIALALSAPAAAQVSVRGYTTRNGTYVAPHYRTTPNRSIYDNYSTRPNVNPYTGQTGTVNPYSSYSAPTYRAPSYSTPSYSSPSSSFGARRPCPAYSSYC